MATISREAALAMIAQVERQTGVMTRRYTGNEVILDRFSDFRAFIDALSEFHLFIDMVENRLGAFGPGERAGQARKLATIRAGILAMEIETTSQFLDRMVTHDRPWPMGSQKFLRRRLTRLDDIAGFHAALGADYELAPPDATQMQNIRDRVAGQIDNSVPLADFGAASPPPEALAPDEPVAEMLTREEPPPVVVEPPPAQQPELLAPDDQVSEISKAPESRPTAPLPAPPPMPDVMIPGVMTFAPSVPKSSTSPSSGPAAAPIPKPPVFAPALSDFVIPEMMLPEAPPPSPPPAPSAPEPVPSRPVSELPPVPPLEGEDFDTDYVSKKAKAVAQLAEKSAAQVPAGAKKPAPQGMARRDFRLKVRNEADGYKYIEGNGLAVMTEVCRIANITIDDLAKTLELSRPGLVLILNGRDPVSTDLLKTLRRLVLRTGGLS